MAKDRMLLGGALIDRLAPLVGVDPTKTRKIIIVAQYDAVAEVYVEMLGDERLLQIEPAHLEDAKINIVNAEKKTKGRL